MIAVLGAGAFGSALAIALANGGRDVTLWGRSGMEDAARLRHVPKLDERLPDALRVTDDIGTVSAEIVLIAVPMQALAAFATAHRDHLSGRTLIACCKGIDLTRLVGPVAILRQTVPDATHGILTGPSFAADIARGLPTALTLASDIDPIPAQNALSTRTLRLYRSTDTIGAELGGALKNVVAIACGATIGAGLGHSARASVMSRGFAEMQRLAAHLGARPDTLTGLSGLGDLALTCTSDLSRNYRFGQSLGRSEPFDPDITVEGAATAQAVARLAERDGLDLPLCQTVCHLTRGRYSVQTAIRELLDRPLKEE